jgi:hypothetical protein
MLWRTQWRALPTSLVFICVYLRPSAVKKNVFSGPFLAGFDANQAIAITVYTENITVSFSLCGKMLVVNAKTAGVAADVRKLTQFVAKRSKPRPSAATIYLFGSTHSQRRIAAYRRVRICANSNLFQPIQPGGVFRILQRTSGTICRERPLTRKFSQFLPVEGRAGRQLDRRIGRWEVRNRLKIGHKLYGKQAGEKFTGTSGRNITPFHKMAEILLQTADNEWQVPR